MKNSKVLNVLSVFTKDEMKQLEKFIRSPYYNTNKSVIKLFGIIKKHYPDFEKIKIEKEEIYLFIYGNKKFNNNVYKNLLNELLNITEEFIFISRYSKKSAERYFVIGEFLLEKGFTGYAEKVFSKGIEESEKNEITYFHFFEQGMLNSAYAFLANQTNKGIGTYKHLNISSDNYISGILMILTDLLYNYSSNAFVYNDSKASGSLAAFLNCFDEKKFSEYALNADSARREYFVMYSNIISLLKNAYLENYGSFIAARDIFFRIKSSLSRHLRSNIYYILLLYAIIHERKSSENYIREQFLLAKNMLEDGTLSPLGKYLDPSAYRTYFLIMIKNKQYEWAEKIMNTLTEKLAPEHKENMNRYSRAHIFFAKKQYDKAIVEIKKIEFSTFIFRVDARTMALKIWYLLGSPEQFFAEADNYRRFIKNNKNLSDSYMAPAGKFIYYAEKLFRLKIDGGTDETANELKDEITNAKMLESRQWLLARANELA